MELLDGVIDLDDLAAPRLTDIQRQVLEHIESRPVSLDIGAMTETAVTRAGHDDFGDPSVHDRLAAHVAAIEADDQLSQLSRNTLRERISIVAKSVRSPNSASASQRSSRFPSKSHSSSWGCRGRAPPTWST